ncbi:hypothetical protein G6F66_014401 [Rhizopus arrhizus]|nr:hypothetical protein G6F66_014401 [Rhizopus arrhizus]
MGAHPVRLERTPAGLACRRPARGRRHDQPAGDRHHLAGGRHADGRHQGERHPQRHPGGVQADRAGHLRRRRPARLRQRQPAAVHALRLRQRRQSSSSPSTASMRSPPPPRNPRTRAAPCRSASSVR